MSTVLHQRFEALARELRQVFPLTELDAVDLVYAVAYRTYSVPRTALTHAARELLLRAKFSLPLTVTTPSPDLAARASRGMDVALRHP